MSYYNSPASYRTQEELRAVTDCPLCGALRGTACTYVGKGSRAAMRQARNHGARMWRAQDILRGFSAAHYRIHPSMKDLQAKT